MTNSLETALYTLSGGILLYMFNKLYENLFIEPRSHYISLKGKIKENLVFHANKFGQKDAWLNNQKEFFDAFDEIRLLAAQCYSLSCLYRTARFFKIIPRKKDLNEVGSLLIGLSNSVSSKKDFKDIIDRKDKIERILKL
jgi:hypothetical protein